MKNWCHKETKPKENSRRAIVKEGKQVNCQEQNKFYREVDDGDIVYFRFGLEDGIGLYVCTINFFAVSLSVKSIALWYKPACCLEEYENKFVESLLEFDEFFYVAL